MNSNERAAAQQPSLSQAVALAVGALLVALVAWVSSISGRSVQEIVEIALEFAFWGIVVGVGALSTYLIHIYLKKQEGVGLKLGTIFSRHRFLPSLPWFLDPQEFRHILVTGTTGAGKSTFIRRFIQQILRNGNRFLYIDFKGEYGDHKEILRICEEEGISKDLQVFDLSRPESCLTLNPLQVFSGVEETVGFVLSIFSDEDANEYYQNEAERFLRYALLLMDASGTARTFLQIEDIFYDQSVRSALIAKAKSRLKKESLQMEAFESFFVRDFESLSVRDRSERYSGFISVLSSFTSSEVKRIFNPEGAGELHLASILSEDRPVIIRVPGEVFGNLSERIVKAFIKVMPILLAKRREQIDRKDYFILMDEGCSYLDDSMLDILKKAGSAQVKMMLTRMCDADFKSVSDAFLGRMISSFSVFVNFLTVCPDTRDNLARLGMTINDVKLTRRVSGGSDTGEASSRDVQKFRIHPSSFGCLSKGEAYVIAPGIQFFEKVKILPPENKKEAA